MARRRISRADERAAAVVLGVALGWWAWTYERGWLLAVLAWAAAGGLWWLRRRLARRQRTEVYRHYGAAYGPWPGRLVYVGVTGNYRERTRRHRVEWWWAGVDERLTTRVMYRSRRAAEAVETVAIRTEDPVVNVRGRRRVERVA